MEDISYQYSVTNQNIILEYFLLSDLQEENVENHFLNMDNVSIVKDAIIITFTEWEDTSILERKIVEFYQTELNYLLTPVKFVKVNWLYMAQFGLITLTILILFHKCFRCLLTRKTSLFFIHIRGKEPLEC